jgi:hypothetical protein
MPQNTFQDVSVRVQTLAKNVVNIIYSRHVTAVCYEISFINAAQIFEENEIQ